MQLSLFNNQIGNKGARYLGEALEKNNVREKSILSFLSYLYYLKKGLKYLGLANNQIGPEGAQYLGEGLQNNKVRKKNKQNLFIIFIFIIFYAVTCYTQPL